MKKFFKTHRLVLIALGGGILGLLLRLWLYGTGMDENRLLVTGHPAAILGLAVTAAVAAAAVLLTRPFRTPAAYSRCLPPSFSGGAGAMAAAAAILLTALTELVRKETPFSVITGILGLAAAAGLALAGYCRIRGTRPRYLCQLAVCLYFLLWLIDRYQLWSADPQLQDYAWQLLATICLMLYSFHRAELDLQDIAPRRMLLLGMLGLYFCCLSVVRSQAPLLYGGMALYLALSIREPVPEREAAA